MTPLRQAVASLALVLCFAATALALSFPPLSGRIVDDAGIIPAATRTTVEAKLAQLEEKSGIQFVVATVKTLEGQEIEPYANELFRNWKLGEKLKNNGVLLLIAPNEHKLRIEVGYGLEGTLTDALSKIVISNAIAPRFKTGDFGGGVERGVDDVITILTTDASEWQARPKIRSDDGIANIWVPLLFAAIMIFIFWTAIRDARPRTGVWGRRNGQRVWLPSGGSSGWSSGWSSGGSSWSGGGGFSGGGGSSGGGGASGGW